MYIIFGSRAFTRKKGRNNVTVDDLVHVISPKGRGEYNYNLHFLYPIPLFVTYMEEQILSIFVLDMIMCPECWLRLGILMLRKK